jgi:hypothetical protein
MKLNAIQLTYSEPFNNGLQRVYEGSMEASCVAAPVCNGLQAQPLVTCFMLISCFAYSLALKMEATHSPKMLVEFQQTT